MTFFCLAFILFGFSPFNPSNANGIILTNSEFSLKENILSSAISDSVVYELGQVDVKPVFQPGIQAWIKHLSSNMSSSSRRSNGTKWFDMMFIIEKDGSLSNMTLVENDGRSLDADALRIMKKAPKWNPGEINGLPVRVLYKMKVSVQTSVGYPGRP